MKKILLFTAILAVALFIPLMVAFAASPAQVEPPADPGAFLQAILALLTSLVGFPAFVGTVLALLMKLFPTVVTDVMAKWISFAANIVMFGVIGFLALSNQLPWVATIDNAFGGLNSILVQILVVVGGFGISFLSTPKYALAVAGHGAGFRSARMLLSPGK